MVVGIFAFSMLMVLYTFSNWPVTLPFPISEGVYVISSPIDALVLSSDPRVEFKSKGTLSDPSYSLMESGPLYE